MTGMPSFALAGVPDQEIWQIVAFLKKLLEVSDADYKSWTAVEVLRPPGLIPSAPLQPAPIPPAPDLNLTPPVTPLAPAPAPNDTPKPPN
jgi:hypothetical protein